MSKNLTAEDIKHRILQYASLRRVVKETRQIGAGNQIVLGDKNQYTLYLRLSGVAEVKESLNSNKIHKTQLHDATFLEETSSLSEEAFLHSIYRMYLNRELDHEGKEYYLRQFDQGKLRHEIIDLIRHSQEFKSKQL